MKILGLIVALLGAVCSFGASKWVELFRKTKEIEDKDILAAKLLGLLLAVAGLVIVFLG